MFHNTWLAYKQSYNLITRYLPILGQLLLFSQQTQTVMLLAVAVSNSYWEKITFTGTNITQIWTRTSVQCNEQISACHNLIICLCIGKYLSLIHVTQTPSDPQL